MNKRLVPRKDTVIRLFAKSGNECSFPDCYNKLFNSDNIFIGEICHIKGVSPLGPRYDDNIDQEKLREHENLILLCHEHHVIVDRNTDKYTADVLRKMKFNHQVKYENQNVIISEIKVEEVLNSYMNRIEQKLEQLIDVTAKNSHLKKSINYEVDENSMKFIPRKRIIIIVVIWLLLLLIFIIWNKFDVGFMLHPLLSLLLIGILILGLAAGIPFVFTPLYSINRESILLNKFYKRTKQFDLISYDKSARCIFPDCNGLVLIKNPPQKEKQNYTKIGQCNKEPKLHTFSCEQDYTIGYFNKMDFSSPENKINNN